MTEENIKEDVQVEDTSTDYIQAINDLKAKSVDRSKYDELRAENKKLLESIVNGREIEMPEEKKQESIEELRKHG